MSQQTEIRTVAFIGAGSMGARMASCLLKAGVNLLICDKSQEVRDTFDKLGAQTTGQAIDCARADLVIVMVHSDEALAEVTIGPNGVSSRSDGIKPKIICVMSTTMPETAQTLFEKAKALGVTLLDAPVSGGPARAEEGSLSIFVGGNAASFQEIQPILSMMGKNIYHCGDVGSASAVKIINNLICITNIYVTAEAYEIASNLGIDIHRLAPILDVSTGRNFISRDINQSIEQFSEWSRNEDLFTAIRHILQKDLSFAVNLLGSNESKNTVAQRVLEYAKSEDPKLLARWKTIANLPFNG